MTSQYEQTFQVAVIGAGPAGLAATVAAADAGAQVVLIDSGAALGGQYWRHPDDKASGAGCVDAGEVAEQHHDLGRYRSLRAAIKRHQQAGTVTVLQRHHVWTIEKIDGFTIRAIDQAARPAIERVVTARSLVIATGAYDRQIPFPGWDLPGVLTAGGVQALLKGNAVVAGQTIIVAGTGPFLLSVGAGLVKAGATVVGIHEANPLLPWLGHARAIAGTATKLGEGMGYAATLARHRVPVRTRSTVVSAHGDERLEAVTIARLDRAGRVRPGTERLVEVDTLAIGWGFTPQLELALTLGCETRLDVDGSLVAVADRRTQMSSMPGALLAGEVCGVGGAALALVEGEIAGKVAARSPIVHREFTALRRQRDRLRSFATAMHRVHAVPAAWTERLTDTTVVCRCEEVTAGTLRETVTSYEIDDPRSAKLLARVGMGWCQGRVCGYATSCLVAEWTGSSFAPQQFAERPVAVPVPLGILAGQNLSDM